MSYPYRFQRAHIAAALALCTLLSSGCATTNALKNAPLNTPVPRELQKMSMPNYVIEPPDILLIEAVDNIRPADDPLRPGDNLIIASNKSVPIVPDDDEVTIQMKRIARSYPVENDGAVDLGPEYGRVQVAGMTLVQARHAVKTHLQEILAPPFNVTVTLETLIGKQQISGEHLVRPDGTVALGIYGSVHITGLTLEQAKFVLEDYLAQFMVNPELSIDVAAYNSKKYYIVTDGGGQGEQVYPFPVTGNETVLDAMALINGLPVVADKKKIWIARPAPSELDMEQILPVDWNSIVRNGSSKTNYQIFPGDRIYVKADGMITFDSFLAKTMAPFERLFGFVILGDGMIRRVRSSHSSGLGGQGGGGGFGGF